MESPVFVSMNE